MTDSRSYPHTVREFQKKPIVIEAWWFPEFPNVYDNAFLHRWINENGGKTQVTERGNAIQTLEGFMLISPGDWIIRGVKGEFYPCKPDIFAASYDPLTTDLKGNRAHSGSEETPAE